MAPFPENLSDICLSVWDIWLFSGFQVDYIFGAVEVLQARLKCDVLCVSVSHIPFWSL